MCVPFEVKGVFFIRPARRDVGALRFFDAGEWAGNRQRREPRFFDGSRPPRPHLSDMARAAWAEPWLGPDDRRSRWPISGSAPGSAPTDAPREPGPRPLRAATELLPKRKEGL